MGVTSARSFKLVSLLSTNIASSATSTSAGSAVDLANYFPVGKREVKFIIASTQSTTSTGFTANVTIQESTSTTTTDFTNALAYDGSTATVSNTDGTQLLTELHAVISKRYVRAIYNSGQATSGYTYAINVAAMPVVRNM